MALLFGHALVGLMFSVLLLEGVEEFGMVPVYLVFKDLPFFCTRMRVLSRQIMKVMRNYCIEKIRFVLML